VDIKGKITLQEILSQPVVWADTLKVFMDQTEVLINLWYQNKFEQVLFVGCGSTYYLSLTSSVIFQKYHKLPVFAMPASELCLFEDIYLDKNKKTLLIAVSRSGETTETVRSMQIFKNGNYGKTIAITTVPESSVTKYADISLIADSAQEISIAQTRSFACMLLMAEALALQLNGQNAVEILASFPNIVASLLDKYHDLAKSIGNDKQIERFFFLGSAYNFGIASEAMLKMKEMSLSNSEAFHTLEFRHGPKSMVDDKTLIVGLVSESSDYQEIPVLQEMAFLGAKVLSISDQSELRLEEIGDVIELNSGVPEPVRALLFLPILQLLAYYRAISQGQDPDNPQNLDAVVRIPSMVK
jgi:glutamine---fructose-6-phosphate transaminase (isomerizing)